MRKTRSLPGHNALGIRLRCFLLIANGVPQRIQSPYDALKPYCEGDPLSIARVLLYLLQFRISPFSPCQMDMGLGVDEATQ